MAHEKIVIKSFIARFKSPDCTITIKRIANTNKFKDFKLIPIGNEAYWYFGFQINRDPLKLPKLYAALVYLTGESDNRYDNYKGSFSFMFEIDVQNKDKNSQYYYHLYHYRSYIQFSLYHIVSQDDPRDPVIINKPDEELFPDKEITSFSVSFCNDVIKHMEEDKYTPQPFVKFSDSNLLSFGYSQGEYFVKNYEDEDKYLEEKKLLQKEILTTV